MSNLLTKDQTLAAMDAQIIRVEAKRKEWLVRRTWRWTIAYPALKRVPLDARSDLMDEARRYASRQWLLYVVAAFLIVMLCWLVLSKPLQGFEPPVRGPLIAWMFVSFALIRLVADLYIRRYLREATHTLNPPNHSIDRGT